MSARATLSRWLVRAAHASGAAPLLQRFPGLYRPLRIVLGTVTARGGVREIVAGPLRGYSLVLGPGDRNAYIVDRHERSIVDLAARLCQPGFCVLDIGAHIGYFSLLFAIKAGPTGRVVTIEPNPANVAKIRAMVAANGLRNLELIPVAVSDEDGELPFVTEETGQMGHLVTRDQPAPGTNAVVVRVARLDDLARVHGIDRVDLIKMDIEGAEVKALAGMAGLLDRFRPTVICEWHPRQAGASYVDVFDRLGYRCEFLEPASTTEPFHLLARPRATGH